MLQANPWTGDSPGPTSPGAGMNDGRPARALLRPAIVPAWSNCGTSGDSMSEAVTAPSAAGRILRVGILSAMAKIDPREAVDNVSGMVLGQIFEAPYTLNAGETTV